MSTRGTPAGQPDGAGELTESVAYGTTGVPALDALGWPAEGAVAAVARRILDGETVALHADVRWPLPALPPNVRAPGEPSEAGGDAGNGGDTGNGASPDAGTSCGGPALWVTDEVVLLGPDEAVVRPPSLVAGIGAGSGVTAAEVLELIEVTLDDAGLSPRSLTALATVDAKVNEAGLISAAARLGVPLRTYSAETLSRVDVPNPSHVPRATVGTPSVAEAAALLEAGTGELLVPKAKSFHPDGAPARATAAVARRVPSHSAHRTRVASDTRDAHTRDTYDTRNPLDSPRSPLGHEEKP